MKRDKEYIDTIKKSLIDNDLNSNWMTNRSLKIMRMFYCKNMKQVEIARLMGLSRYVVNQIIIAGGKKVYYRKQFN